MASVDRRNRRPDITSTRNEQEDKPVTRSADENMGQKFKWTARGMGCSSEFLASNLGLPFLNQYVEKMEFAIRKLSCGCTQGSLGQIR